MSPGQPCDPSLATGHAVVAAVREEEFRVAARAVVDLLNLLDAGGAQLCLGDRTQVEHAAVCHAVVVRERLEDLGPDLVTALPDAGTDRGALRSETLRGHTDQTAGKTAPSAMQHRDRPVAGDRNRQAVGNEYKRRDAWSPRDVPVDLQVSALWIEERLIGIRRVPLADLAAVDLPAHHHVLRVCSGLLRERATVVDHDVAV